MPNRAIVDQVKDAIMVFTPSPVSYMRVSYHDYRSSEPKIQVVDLRGR